MRVRILHISDLHARGHGAADAWRRGAVLGDAWERNLDAILADGPVDLVCFTGDIAFSGRREEYDEATGIVRALLQRLQVEDTRFFTIPGNHDVDRSRADPEYRGLRREVSHARDRLAELSCWLEGRCPPPHGIDGGWREAVLGRQEAFYRWTREDLKLVHLPGAAWPLGWRVTVQGLGGPVHVIGLNTAWLSGEEDVQGLPLTDAQLAHVVTPEGRELAGLRILLMHHPFADLLDGRMVRQRLAGKVDVVLRGHLHATESSHYLIDGDRGFAELAVSSLCDSHAVDQYPNGCQVVTVHVAGGQPAGTVWFRSWSPTGGHWYDDNSLYASTRNGRLDWGLAPVVGPLAGVRLPRGAAPADYLGCLRAQVSREGSAALRRPDRVYVPQPGVRVGGGPGDGARVALEDVAAAFWSGARRRVMVLGNFGMGKTYYALRTVTAQIDAFHHPGAGRLPIYFPLRRFLYEAATARDERERRDLVQQILDAMVVLDFPRVSRDEFVALLRQGVFTVVLDGLDELNLPRGVHWGPLLQPLLEIDAVPCLVTSRTAYLEDRETELVGWDAYELRDWGPAEWEEYVERCAGELHDVGGPAGMLKLVDERPALRRLVTRPLWCYMIVDVRTLVRETDDMGMADLYQTFIDRALPQVDRGEVAQQVLEPPEKQVVLERFAEICALQDRTTLGTDELLDMSHRLLADADLGKLERFALRDVKVYSFLNCDQHGQIGFGHASFQTYFLAAGLVRDLVRYMEVERPVRMEPTSYLSARELRDDEIQFLAGILCSERAMRGLGLLPEGVSYVGVPDRLEAFVRQQLAPSSTSPVLRRNLFLTLLAVLGPGGRDGRRPVVQGLNLSRVQLPHQSLASCDFVDVNFTGANLAGAMFTGCRLEKCCFAAATLDRADFTGADLSGADLRSIQPPVAPPCVRGALNLDEAQMDPRTRTLLAKLAC